MKNRNYSNKSDSIQLSSDISVKCNKINAKRIIKICKFVQFGTKIKALFWGFQMVQLIVKNGVFK